MAASCTKDKRLEQPVLSGDLLKNLSEASEGNGDAVSSEVGKGGIPSVKATVSCDVNNQTLTLGKSLYWHTCQACSGEYVEERSDEVSQCVRETDTITLFETGICYLRVIWTTNCDFVSFRNKLD